MKQHIYLFSILLTVLAVASFIPYLIFAGYTPQPPVFDPGGNVQRETLLGNATPIQTAAQIINWILSILAIIAISLIVFAGFVWMLASGNDEKIGSAKEILKGALYGLIIILSSYGVTNYVFENLVNVTTK